MRVLSFIKDGKTRLGLVTDGGILDIAAAATATATGSSKDLPGTMEDLISQGEDGLNKLRELATEAGKGTALLKEDTLEFAPVVARPDKMLCVGWNYLSHIEETKTRTDLPRFPEIFGMTQNSLSAHKRPIKLPPAAWAFDYEAELVIVIGKECFMVPESKALDYVFGYTCGNDFSERDLQKRNTQWFLAKSLDGFSPVGPYVATANSIDPDNLDISMKRGDVVVQSSNTRQLVFKPAHLVSYLSQYLTLKPGDLIFTGTPSGVILGQPAETRKWVGPGETLTVSIEGIGDLVNTTS